MLRTYIIHLNVAAFAKFSASRANRNRINVRSELIDGVRDGKLTNYSLREDGLGYYERDNKCP